MSAPNPRPLHPPHSATPDQTQQDLLQYHTGYTIQAIESSASSNLKGATRRYHDTATDGHALVQSGQDTVYGQPSRWHNAVYEGHNFHVLDAHQQPYTQPHDQLNPQANPYENSEGHSRVFSSRITHNGSAASHSSVSRSPPPVHTPKEPTIVSSAPSRTTGKRREKPKIELAPDQPLTTHGKPRTRVFVACVQCRMRKIRCDGAKPVCHNCSRKPLSDNEIPQTCSYDTAPKRRGPDRNPGSRQRGAAEVVTEGGKVRRRRKREPETASNAPVAIEPTTSVSKDDESDLPDTYSQTQKHDQPSIVVVPVSNAENITTVVGDTQGYTGVLPSQLQPSYSSSSSLSYTSIGTKPAVQAIVSHSLSTQRDSQYIQGTYPSELQPMSEQHRQTSFQGTVSAYSYTDHAPPPSRASAVNSDDKNQYTEESDEVYVYGLNAEPSAQFTRETWWDALLGLYSSHYHGQPLVNSLTSSTRDSMAHQISLDLRFLFKYSNYWFSFVNVPRFFARLFEPEQRRSMQPALIYAALGAGILLQSSNQEYGEKGRAWAEALIDQAQCALQASISSRWIDEGLVQASWLIAFFEISPHPKHSSTRVRSALSMLDSLIRSLALSGLDRDDPRTSTFASSAVPTVSPSAASNPASAWVAVHQSSHIPQTESSSGECGCSALTLGHNWLQAQEHTPLWLMTPAWNAVSGEAEVRREECRRVVWSSITMVAGYTSYTAAHTQLPTMDLFLMDPANYALLFPAETLVLSPSNGPSKNTVWALYMRTMLLWHSCIRMRWLSNLSDAERAQFAVAAWLEVDRIEAALNSHTCAVERAFLYHGREYLFNTRMCISYEFQRFIPQATANANLIFHRKKAEEWLTYQGTVAKRTLAGLQTVTGQPNVSLARRPFFIPWFMSQISRALILWSCDRTLTVALEVCKALLAPVDYLMALWPCPAQQKRYARLYDDLLKACMTAGITPPPSRP